MNPSSSSGVQFSSSADVMMSYQEEPLVLFFSNYSSCCAIRRAILVEPGHRSSTASKNFVRKSDSAVVAEGERFERVSIFFQPTFHQLDFGGRRMPAPPLTPDAFPDWNFRSGGVRADTDNRRPAPAGIGNDDVE